VEFEVAGKAAFELNFLDEDCYGPLPVGAKLTFHSRTFFPELIGGKWMVRWWEE
jgi:hypothetical protein